LSPGSHQSLDGSSCLLRYGAGTNRDGSSGRSAPVHKPRFDENGQLAAVSGERSLPVLVQLATAFKARSSLERPTVWGWGNHRWRCRFLPRVARRARRHFRHAHAGRTWHPVKPRRRLAVLERATSRNGGHPPRTNDDRSQKRCLTTASCVDSTMRSDYCRSARVAEYACVLKRHGSPRPCSRDLRAHRRVSGTRYDASAFHELTMHAYSVGDSSRTCRSSARHSSASDAGVTSSPCAVVRQLLPNRTAAHATLLKQ
jgi:hypothetical protein